MKCLLSLYSALFVCAVMCILGLGYGASTANAQSPIPNRPGNDFHPQVRVDWQVSNPFSCFVLNKAVVSVTLTAGGKTQRSKRPSSAQRYLP